MWEGEARHHRTVLGIPCGRLRACAACILLYSILSPYHPRVNSLAWWVRVSAACRTTARASFVCPTHAPWFVPAL
eukprot:6129202-Prymnesium_polylepis.1